MKRAVFKTIIQASIDSNRRRQYQKMWLCLVDDDSWKQAFKLKQARDRENGPNLTRSKSVAVQNPSLPFITAAAVAHSIALHQVNASTHTQSSVPCSSTQNPFHHSLSFFSDHRLFPSNVHLTAITQTYQFDKKAGKVARFHTRSRPPPPRQLELLFDSRIMRKLE
jgi:hypothetical protein